VPSSGFDERTPKTWYRLKKQTTAQRKGSFRLQLKLSGQSKAGDLSAPSSS
jgi:hypothetical protein